MVVRRFTLVELAIVVAIVALLAAIAIPAFATMQLRAKRSEILVNVDGISAAIRAYQASFDTLATFADGPRPRPDSALDKSAAPWNGSEGPLFPVMGWAPDGDVRGNYSVGWSSPVNYTAAGASDVDDNGVLARALAGYSSPVKLYTAENVY